jgi:LNS2-like protein (lipin/Ned1/Smp2)
VHGVTGMRTRWLMGSTVLGCVACGSVPVGVDPDEVASGGAAGKADGHATIPDVRCAGAPAAGAAGEFRHFSSSAISFLGNPKHRGADLVTSAGSATQTLEGWISYTIADKALEDEDVDVFACRAGQWSHVGTARTDDEGHFALDLSDTYRLPIGMRDLSVSVAGDRTGVGFLGYVAPDDSPLIVSDVDGTLTSSENAFLETITLGIEPAERLGAPRAYAAATAKGFQLVYVTARGSQYTTATRDWLEHRGFPRGPVRLSPSFLTLPGGDTIDYKTRTLAALSASGLEVAAGIGNRASDVTAYASTHLPASRIFIEMPEYASEVQPLLNAHAAIGFTTYDELSTSYLAKLP